MEGAAEQSNEYSGKIFACAKISGTAEKIEGKSYAFLSEVHVFDQPVSANSFEKFAKVGQGTSRPLYGSKFEGIKGLLSEQNSLPEFLRCARIGGPFRDANQDNWPSVCGAAEKKFENELQMRVYLLDFLLSELKDERTSLLEECRCYPPRKKSKEGYADYMVKVYGSWVPVETKREITPTSLRYDLDQTRKYVRADSFVPTQGAYRGERFEESTSNVCLVVDQSGIYITSDGEFVGCSLGSPIWRREELDHSLVSAIRDLLKKELQ